jgi:Ca-activated chloride channel family protein
LLYIGCMSGYRYAPLLAGLLTLATVAWLQSPALSQEAEPGFSDQVSVGYVLVPVLVRTHSGGYAKNLDEKDFQLLVDGRRVDIDSFETRADAPASVIFLQDLSGSMDLGTKLQESRDAVRYFLDRAVTGDEFAIATFAGGKQQVEVPFTQDRAALRESLGTWRPWGTTTLHDAVSWIPQISLSGRNPKRFAILVTDGVDNASTFSPVEARRVVRAAQVPVYVLGLESGDPFELTAEGKKVYRNADVLNLLAHETGGRYFSLREDGDLEKALAEMAQDFRHQYVLGFPTGEGKSQYRQLEVKVDGRNRPVLFRRGYQGPPPGDIAQGG